MNQIYLGFMQNLFPDHLATYVKYDSKVKRIVKVMPLGAAFARVITFFYAPDDALCEHAIAVSFGWPDLILN